MIVIHSAEELAYALTSSLDPSVLMSLAAHRGRLLEYEGYALEELVLFLIVQPGDTLDTLNAASGVRLVQDSSFASTAECIDRLGNWLELLFIQSDDGFGVVLFVPLHASLDALWLTAIEAISPDGRLPLEG